MGTDICPEYLLPEEVARLFDRIPRFCLWPRTCRAMASIPVIDAALCRGCGLCATGWPREAIGIQKVRESVLEAYYA